MKADGPIVVFDTNCVLRDNPGCGNTILTLIAAQQLNVDSKFSDRLLQFEACAFMHS